MTKKYVKSGQQIMLKRCINRKKFNWEKKLHMNYPTYPTSILFCSLNFALKKGTNFGKNKNMQKLS